MHNNFPLTKSRAIFSTANVGHATEQRQGTFSYTCPGVWDSDLQTIGLSPSLRLHWNNFIQSVNSQIFHDGVAKDSSLTSCYHSSYSPSGTVSLICNLHTCTCMHTHKHFPYGLKWFTTNRLDCLLLALQNKIGSM